VIHIFERWAVSIRKLPLSLRERVGMSGMGIEKLEILALITPTLPLPRPETVS
jgi:hypothetical protein